MIFSATQPSAPGTNGRRTCSKNRNKKWEEENGGVGRKVRGAVCVCLCAFLLHAAPRPTDLPRVPLVSSLVPTCTYHTHTMTLGEPSTVPGRVEGGGQPVLSF